MGDDRAGYGNVLDTLPVAVGCATSATGEIRYVNPAMAALFGRAPGEFAGMTLTDLLGSDLPGSDGESAEVILGQGSAQRIVEVRMSAPAGLDRVSGAADRDETGIVTFVLQDLTDQRRAERNLAELARFPEKNPGPVLWIERSGKILLANRAARNILGEDIVGTSMLGPPSGMDSRDWHAITQSTEVVRHEIHIGDVCYSVAYVTSDQDNFVFAFGSDIADLKKAQSEVAEIARFPDMNPGPVLRLDTGGHVLLANRAAQAVFGGAVVGACWKEIYPGSAERWDDILVAEQPIYLEARFSDSDYVFAHRSDPQTDLVFVFGADISQQKAAERSMRQSEKMATLGTLAAGVAHELNNPAAATRRAADQLRAAFARYQAAQVELGGLALDAGSLAQLRAIDTRARERSGRPSDLDTVTRSDLEADVEDWLDDHDVPDPSGLAPMLVEQGLVVDALEDLAGGLDETVLAGVVRWAAAVYPVYRLAYEIGQGSTRISEIVGALKGYSYLGQASVQAIDLHEGIDNTLVILRNKLKAGVDVIREYSGDLPLVPAYGSELNQVWTNLLANAIDAIGSSGTITIRTGADGDDVVVEVEDDGPGIPADMLSRVCDPFFTTKGARPGHRPWPVHLVRGRGREAPRADDCRIRAGPHMLHRPDPVARSDGSA